MSIAYICGSELSELAQGPWPWPSSLAVAAAMILFTAFGMAVATTIPIHGNFMAMGKAMAIAMALAIGRGLATAKVMTQWNRQQGEKGHEEEASEKGEKEEEGSGKDEDLPEEVAKLESSIAERLDGALQRKATIDDDDELCIADIGDEDRGSHREGQS